MKRKIISTLVITSLFIFIFAVSVFASVPPVSMYDYTGSSPLGEPLENDHYKEYFYAHNCYTGCEICAFYKYGYESGAADGYEKGMYDSGSLNIEEIINNYKSSDEYKAEFNAALIEALEEYKQEFYESLSQAEQQAVEEYKSSQEFSDIKNEQYSLGEQAGLQAGLEQGEMQAAQKYYNRGYTDGKYSYTTSNEFEQELQNAANYGYDYGYNDGLKDGSEREPEESALLKILITIFISVTILILIFIAMSLIVKKVKRKKTR